MNLNTLLKSAVLASITGLGLMSVIAHADTAPTPAPPGYLKDYNYQVVNLVDMEDAKKLMRTQVDETRNRSICANRAHMWSYDIYRKKHVQVGKVFIHFTALGQADENKQWAYHVAPYVLVNGEEVVLDSGFDYFKKKPSKMETWTEYFGKSKNCVVLDPINNPAHLALEQYNMPNSWDTPLTYKSGACRQYPVTEGICYIRKVPMYYAYPIDVYGADLYLSGKQEFAKYNMDRFNKEEVLNACKQATSTKFKMEHSCSDYFGF